MRFNLVCFAFKVAVLAIASGAAFAGDIEFTDVSNTVENEIITVNGDAQLTFSDDAIDALNSGIPLVFDLDSRIKQVRRYLPDKKIFQTRRQLTIERHALSEQFVVTDSITADRRVFGTLSSAIENLGRIRNLAITDTGDLPKDATLQFSIRLKLDIESLPAPMVAVAYLSPGWHMSSGWKKWQLTR